MGVLKMIKLPDGEFKDYLPSAMKNDVDMICLSYALKKATERLLKYQKQTMVYNFIDTLPEQICDVLAVDLHSPYYSDLMTIEVKRNIIKNTLRWYAKAGTPEAVEELIQAVFGEGKIIEWPDFDTPPYTPGTFDIVTSAMLTPNVVDYLFGIIDRVKNVRSHLRRILIKRRIEQNIFAGTAHETYYKPAAIIGGYNEKRTTHQKLFAGISPFSDYKPATITDGYAEQRISEQEFFTGTSQILNYKPVAITDSYSIANIVEQKFFAGADQFLHYKPAAVAEGYQTTKIINQNLHMKAIAIAQYKPSAVIADAAN